MGCYDFQTSLAGSAVDREAGVIRGVSVVTEGPAKGHVDPVTGKQVVVDAVTLAQMKACAEQFETGLKVKAGHGSGVFATAGYLKNFRIDGDRLRADLYLLATEDNRDKLLEMAAAIPDTFGLSVSFSGEDEVKADRILARCTEIYSADLVPEPAANPSGLFERRKSGRPFGPNVAQLSEDEAPLPQLAAMPPDALVHLTYRQLSQLSTVSTGSISFRLQADHLEPAVPRSMVFRAGDVREWSEKQIEKSVARIERAWGALAPAAKPPDPHENHATLFRKKWSRPLKHFGHDAAADRPQKEAQQ